MAFSRVASWWSKKEAPASAAPRPRRDVVSHPIDTSIREDQAWQTNVDALSEHGRRLEAKASNHATQHTALPYPPGYVDSLSFDVVQLGKELNTARATIELFQSGALTAGPDDKGLLQQLHKAEASKVELLQRHTGIINDLRLERDQAVISNNTLEKQVRALQAAAKQAEHSKQHDRAQIDGLQRMLVEQHELTEAEARQGLGAWTQVLSSKKRKAVQQQQQQQKEAEKLQEQHRQQLQELQQKLITASKQCQSLHEEKNLHIQQHKDALRRADEQIEISNQQLGMMREQTVALSQQLKVQATKPAVFNYLTDSETTADGYPLSGIASALKQNLHKSIMQLFRIVSQQQPQAMNALLTSQANPWPLIHSQWQKQKRSAGQSRLLRDGFIHAVLLQLEVICWRHHADVALAFCFVQKTQIASSIAIETQKGNLAMEHAPGQRTAADLDLYTKNCQYWLSKSTQDPSVLWLIAEHFAPELFYHFWPGCNIDGAPNEIMAGFHAVVTSAVQMRLHVESCHPCLLLAVGSQVKDGEVCITPAVVVDPSMTTATSGSGVRVLAEVENLNDG